ncbi:MAG: GAF domain-containing protein [Deltaproteobacteria bacterium]|nr:GAF domain-containing protein [Deltaproteobacteria bacterium]
MIDGALEIWLKQYIADNGGVAGTVHVRQGEDLQLGAAVNIPPIVVQKVQRVPRGKGMAGLALERDAPVQTCNLKEDATGDVRPGAKAVNANAAAAIPIHDPAGHVRGIVGIAFMQEREIDAEEMERLKKAAENAPV